MGLLGKDYQITLVSFFLFHFQKTRALNLSKENREAYGKVRGPRTLLYKGVIMQPTWPLPVLLGGVNEAFKR